MSPSGALTGARVEPLLAVEALTVSVNPGREQIPVVRGVDFVLQPGRSLGIVGESGSGKSMTARAIIGILPKKLTRTSGSIRFDGKEAIDLSATEWQLLRGSTVSMVFQDPRRSLDPTMTIGDQIMETVRKHMPTSRDEARDIAMDWLGKVRLSAPAQRFHEYPHQISGGMCQRVAIAIALSCRPRILIADEPTTALDVTTQAEIMELIKELQSDLNMALILISHDIALTERCTDEIVVMYAGRFVEKLPSSRLFKAQMPYTQALLEALPTLGRNGGPLKVLTGRPPVLTQLPTGCPFHPRCARSGDMCLSSEPELLERAEDHRVACWYPYD